MHTDFINIAQRCYEREASTTDREAHARTVRRRMDYHLLPHLRQTSSSGDETLQNLNSALDKFGYVRSKVQRQLHHAFLNAVYLKLNAFACIKLCVGLPFYLW